MIYSDNLAWQCQRASDPFVANSSDEDGTGGSEPVGGSPRPRLALRGESRGAGGPALLRELPDQHLDCGRSLHLHRVPLLSLVGKHRGMLWKEEEEGVQYENAC